MALSPSGDRLYVTNANSDTVSVIDTRTDTVRKTLHVGLAGKDGKPRCLGSSPNAVIVSPDGRTLYVANAVPKCRRRRRPGQASSGQRGARAHSDRLVSHGRRSGRQRSAVVHRQRIRIRIPGPDPADPSGPKLLGPEGRDFLPGRARPRRARRFTKQVLRLTTAPSRLVARARPDDAIRFPKHIGQRSPIKHVFYIIKENRTYDQVFGALPQGNGDPSLVQFGRDVSPNHHALVEQFVAARQLLRSW